MTSFKGVLLDCWCIHRNFYCIFWWIKCKGEFELSIYKVAPLKGTSRNHTVENGYTDAPWRYKIWHQLPTGSIQLTTSSSDFLCWPFLFQFTSVLLFWCYISGKKKLCTCLISLKGTVSDKKNLQITLDIKKNTFQSQNAQFFSKKLHNFDRKNGFS